MSFVARCHYPQSRRLLCRGWRLDLALTALFTIFWLWFAWQHGAANSPDSWYRGVLAKSIAEGHPYWINLKQGWLYDFEPWHHDAAHSPLLPMLYAISYWLFGVNITVANIVVAASSGMAVLPLLRLSRALTGTVVAGLVIYAWVVFNANSDFLFEVFAGLSIPAALFVLATALLLLWRLLTRPERRYIEWCALAFAAYFYVRPGEQLLCMGLLVASLGLGYFMLPAPVFARLRRMWLYVAVLAVPWLLRSMILFGSPLFTHMTPMMWTDRSYDYWTYHETIPLPTPSSYFETHTVADLGGKILNSAADSRNILDLTLDGRLPYYVALLVVAAVALFGVRGRRKRFFLATVATLLLGYTLLHAITPIVDKRYMVMPIFCGLVFAVFALSGRWTRAVWLRRAALVGIAMMFLPGQWRFWSDEFPRKLVFSYSNADAALRDDPTMRALRQRLTAADVVLAPFAEAQRLNFTTGSTMVERPDNLTQLTDPMAFFRRYGIRYSLVDVTRILPDRYIESIELLGNHPLYTIRLDGLESTPALNATSELALRRSSGDVYVDAFHGGAIPSDSVFTNAGLSVVAHNSDVVGGKNDLMRARLLVVRYEIGRAEFSPSELQLIDQYIAAGGRILLLCPGWVAASYDHRELASLGFNRIGSRFGVMIGSEMSDPPFAAGNAFGVAGTTIEFSPKPTFSRLIGRATMQTVLADLQGHPVAAANVLPNGARIVVWGHSNLFDDALIATPDGRAMAQRIVAWLIDDE